MIKTYQLPSGIRYIDIDLFSASITIPAIALELLPFGATSFTSVSAPDIQLLSGTVYRITLTEEQLSNPGFLLFSLVSTTVGPEFPPIIGMIYSTVVENGEERISGIPANRDVYLPVKAFSFLSLPVTGLTFANFSLSIWKSNNAFIGGFPINTFPAEITRSPSSASEVIEPLNEFSTARGVYLIKFFASELDKIGDFYFESVPVSTSFVGLHYHTQITAPKSIVATFEVRDTSPGIVSPVPVLPTVPSLFEFVGTSVPVNRLEFNFSQFGSGYIGLDFQYYNGTSFTSLTFIDGTDNFTKNGAVTWELPNDQLAGGPGAPNASDYFIKIVVTSIAGNAELETLRTGAAVPGVILTIYDDNSELVETLITNDLGIAVVSLDSGDYVVQLQKTDHIFSFNNVQVTIFGLDAVATLDISTFAQDVVLEGEAIITPAPSVPADTVVMKMDLVNLSGLPVQRQEARMVHKFAKVFFAGTNTVVDRELRMITDHLGHAEAIVISGSVVDVNLVNTSITRQITIPEAKSGTGDTIDPAPTGRFESTVVDTFVATDVNSIIEISGIDYVITRVVDDQEIEVSPIIGTDLTGASWSIRKFDLFSLISVAPDQFSVVQPTFEDFAIRGSF
jgi:hypothetical protein